MPLHTNSRLRMRRFIVGTVLLLCIPLVETDADTIGSEYAVKAAVVYKIAKFVSWPETAFDSSDEPLSICLPTDDPIGPAMNGLSGDIVHGRTIEIRTIEPGSLQTTDCEVLFISAGPTRPTADLIAQINRRPILTIGDGDDFDKLGGIVSLRIKDNRIHFAINMDASNSAGLNISAQLLQLARTNGSR